MTSEAVSQQHIGTLYGIGVGPGAPDLLTLRAERILKQCPVICLPASTGRRSYAGTIIETHIDHSWQEIVAVKFPMRNVWEQALPARNEAVMTLLSYLQSGRDVAFVTEGDPLLYSTFGYMLDAVRQSNPEIHIEVIPGITSITAAAAAAQLPLTSWDERLAVLPAFHVLEQNAERGTDTESPLRSIFQLFDTVVLLKVNKIFDPLLDLLEELDLVQSAVFVRRCSTDQEEVIFDIQCLRGQTLDYFSLLIVRKSHAIYHR